MEGTGGGAGPREAAGRRHVVAVAAVPDAPFFELAIPCEIFGRTRAGMADLGYEVRVCRPAGGAARLGHGLVAGGESTYADLATADTVVVPAVCDPMREQDPELVAAVRQAAANGARIASLCTGAFVLAEAGLLDGRRATTHWLYAAELARRHPAVTVDPDVLYVMEDRVLTSAGTAAGIDLCLAMVAADRGAAVANTLARRIVAAPQRDGGQAQYIDAPAATDPGDGMAPLLDWMREHLDEPLTVAGLARHANVAERTLIRRFHGATGTTPIKWLTAQRVRRARELLETTDLPMERVAEACGLGSTANLRQHFTLAIGVPPSSYRRSFKHAG